MLHKRQRWRTAPWLIFACAFLGAIVTSVSAATNSTIVVLVRQANSQTALFVSSYCDLPTHQKSGHKLACTLPLRESARPRLLLRMPGSAEISLSRTATIERVGASPVARFGSAVGVSFVKIDSLHGRLILGKARSPEKVTITLALHGSRTSGREVLTFVAVPLPSR